MSEDADNGPLSRMAVRVTALCFLVLVLDGYDLFAMGFTAPAIAEAWQFKPAALTPALTASSIGLLLGALLWGSLGDRFGRKPALLGCVALFGLMSMLTAFVNNLTLLTAVRFFTGIGLGGGIPLCVALLSDVSSRRLQGTLVIAMSCGMSVGSLAAGALSVRFVHLHGWQSVFLIGGLTPLAALPLLVFLLPEAPGFVRRRDRSGPGAQGSVSALFQNGNAVRSSLVWSINFLSFVTIFFLGSWSTLMFTAMGASQQEAISIASMSPLGSLAGGIVSSQLARRFAVESVLVLMLGCGATAILVTALLGTPGWQLRIVFFFVGLGVNASQHGINALSGAIYPLVIRGTGVGWATGVGRFGSIAGPLLGGWLYYLQWPPRQMFMMLCIPVLLVLVGVLAVARSRRIFRPVSVTPL